VPPSRSWLAQYLRTIGYKAWIEDTNGNEMEEAALKKALKSRVKRALLIEGTNFHAAPSC
jgi:hypothetical protein